MPYVGSSATECPGGCGTTNYVQSVGDNANSLVRSGPFGLDRLDKGVKYNEILDGLSNTAVFSEILLGPGTTFTQQAVGVVPFGDNDFYTVATRMAPGDGGWVGNDNPSAPDTVVPYAICDNPTKRVFYGRGKQYYKGSMDMTYYSHTLTPNSFHRDCVMDRVNLTTKGHLAARSFHPGGVLYLLGDGAVKFANESISETVWRAMGSKAGGESLTAF